MAVSFQPRGERIHGREIGRGKKSIPGRYLGGRRQAGRGRHLDLRHQGRGSRGRSPSDADVRPMGKSQIPRGGSDARRLWLKTHDKVWPDPTRVRWFRTFAMNVSRDGDDERVELKIELEGGGK